MAGLKDFQQALLLLLCSLFFLLHSVSSIAIENADIGLQVKLLSASVKLPPPQAHMLSATCKDEVLGERLFIFGGQGKNGVRNDVFSIAYDTFDQFASKADASSELCTREGWSGYCASDATGPPDTPHCGEYKSAWMSKAYGLNWLSVGFSTPVYATAIVVRETLSPGFVVKIELIDVDNATHIVFEGKDTTKECPGHLRVTFPKTPYLVVGANITMNTEGWEAIDSVKLVGYAGERISANELADGHGEYEPIALTSAIGTFVNSTFLFFGGRENNGKYSTRLYEFDPFSEEFSVVHFEGSLASPPSRISGAAGGIGTEMYMYGGFNPTSLALNDLWVFDIVSAKWREIKPKNESGLEFPAPRYECKMIVYQERYLFILGGETFDGSTNELWRYDTFTNDWKLMAKNDPNAPPASISFVMDRWDDKIVVVGGYSIELGPLGDIYLYNIPLDSWSVIRKQPGAVWPESRFSHAGGVASDKLIIFGGTTANTRYVGDYWEFNLISNSWEQILFPAARQGHTASLYFDGILIHGGATNEEDFRNDLWLFNLTTKRWKEVTTYGSPMPEVAYHTSVEFANKLYFFGGCGIYGPTNDLYQLDLTDFTWAKVESKSIDRPSPRCKHHAARRQREMYVVGGYGNGPLGLKDYWVYRFALGQWENLKVTVNSTVPRGANLQFYESAGQLINGEFYVLGGRDTDTFSPHNTVWKLNSAKELGIYYTVEDALSYNLLFAMSSSITFNTHLILLAGGELPRENNAGFSPFIFAFDTLQKKFFRVASMSHPRSRAAMIQHNDNIFIIGGLSASGVLNDVWRFRATGVCPHGISNPADFLKCTQCPPGHFVITDPTAANGYFCSECPLGSFALSFGSSKCEQCDPGLVNNFRFAKSYYSCSPCPEGTVNLKLLSEPSSGNICKPCNTLESDPNTKLVCPLAASIPLNRTLYAKNSFTKKNPKYEQETFSQAQNIQFYVILAIIVLGGCLFLILMTFRFCSHKLMRRFVKPLDFFSRRHWAKLKEPVIVRKTVVGGALSVIYCFAATAFCTALVVPYFVSNRETTQTLVPALTNDEPIYADFSITTTLYGYRGPCNQADIKHIATSWIFNSTSQLTVDNIYDKEKSVCTLAWTCKRCRLTGKSSELRLIFQSQQVLAHLISWNIVVSSSVPRLREDGAFLYVSTERRSQSTTLSGQVVPDPNTVFRGEVNQDPTQLKFSLFPTIFLDKRTSILPRYAINDTGYHIEFVEAIKGSSVTQQTFHFGDAVTISYRFDRSENILSIITQEKQSMQALFASLLGGVSGLFGGFGLLLSFIEFLSNRVIRWKPFSIIAQRLSFLKETKKKTKNRARKESELKLVSENANEISLLQEDFATNSTTEPPNTATSYLEMK